MPLSDEEVLSLGHRAASKYRHDCDGPSCHRYEFQPHTLLQFASAVAEAAVQAAREKQSLNDDAMDSKSKAIPTVLDDRWKSILESIIREMPRAGRNGNAPGHAHSKPGIWDSDNGELAGKPCAWCLAWSTATAMLAAGQRASSCPQNAETRTHQPERVDETENNEHEDAARVIAGPHTRAPGALQAGCRLVALLRQRYSPSTIPPCRVCGAELSIQSSGGGEPTIWACSGLEQGEAVRYKAGRSAADAHYIKSRHEDLRRGGDENVMALIELYESAIASSPAVGELNLGAAPSDERGFRLFSAVLTEHGKTLPGGRHQVFVMPALTKGNG